MGYLSNEEIQEIKSKITTNVSELGKKFKAKKNEFLFDKVSYTEAIEKEEDGWEKTNKQYKTVVEIKKEKVHHKKFEDKLWCMMYNLGFRTLNFKDNLKLKYGPNKEDFQQIDVLAVDEEIALIIECKSSKDYTNVNYKNYFEGLPRKIDGFRKCLTEIFGKRRVKYIFATEKQILGQVDLDRLRNTNAFHLDDNATSYVNDIIKNYKKASKFQFFGIIFKGETINLDAIDVPALSGTMGGKKYYMFSIEPGHLLKIGFVLHRTRTNEREDPTYQRLLVPSRLRGIEKFITNDGFFPNSIIVNFNTRITKKRLEFQQSSSKNLDSSSRHGVLKIPNSYSIAYIIDGQHRLYGYANTDEIFDATIPVVAFENLTSDEQLGMFMDINENQKKIAPRLKLTLQEDINWNSTNTLSRMKALRSGIINSLADSIGPFRDYLSIGEETKELSPNFIDNALKKAPGILPKVKKSKLINEEGVLYDLQVQDPQKEMDRVKIYISDLINKSYTYVVQNYKDLFENKSYFIRSNRGLFAFIYALGSINRFITKKGRVNIETSVDERLDFMTPYLNSLLEPLSKLSIGSDDPNGYLKIQGQAAERTWSMYFESIIKNKFPDFYSNELKTFEETQDDKLQNEARIYLDKIEGWIKEVTLNHLKELFGDAWNLEISNIEIDAEGRAKKEAARIWKDDKRNVKINWEDMLYISDYIDICNRFWNKVPADGIEYDENNFKRLFQKVSINSDKIYENSGNKYFEIGIMSSKDGFKWIRQVNNYRNIVAHIATKSYGLNKEEFDYLKSILNTIKP